MSLPGQVTAASHDRTDQGAGLGVLVLLMAAIFGFATCVTMLGPLLVDLSAELEVSLGQAGLLAAAMAVSWALAAPFAGLLSDRFGRRPMIVLALAGLGTVTIGAGLAPSYGALLVTRVLAGVFGGFGPAAVLAAAGDLFPPHRRGMAMGWTNLGFSMAALVGVPAVGAVGGAFGWRWAFVASGVLLLALAVLIRLTFPISRVQPSEGGIFSTYRAVVGVPGLASVLAANLFERALFNLSVLYLPSFLMLSYGLDAVAVAPILVLVAVGNIVGTVGGGWLGDRFSKVGIFLVAQTLSGLVAIALFTQTPGLLVSAAGGALFGLLNASSRPALLALGAELSARHRGAVLGLLSLTNQGGIVLGSSVGGLAIGLGGYVALAWTMAADALLATTLAVPLRNRRGSSH
ncbi:MAG: MFS transporter [Chloroflexi bacterium]|nr:MFS transporter [Chloroflexota bacterium]